MVRVSSDSPSFFMNFGVLPMILGGELREILNFQILKTAGIPGVFCVFLRSLRDPECAVTTSEEARVGATSTQKMGRGNILPYMVSEVLTPSQCSDSASLHHRCFGTMFPRTFMVKSSHGQLG